MQADSILSRFDLPLKSKDTLPAMAMRMKSPHQVHRRRISKV
jgi:hypothetical protein